MRLGARNVAHDPAARIHLAANDAAMTAQRSLHATLDAGAADADAGNAQGRIVAHREALHCADVAYDVTDDL